MTASTAHDVIPPPVASCPLPLAIDWTGPDGPRPLSIREIRPIRRRAPQTELSPVFQPELFHTGNGEACGPFDFSFHVARLCEDVVARCACFHHIDPRRMLFCVTQARTTRSFGLQAKITPMRFRHGQRVRRRRGRIYQVQRYSIDGVEMLYLVTFCLPRFLDQSFDEKLITIFHELYHIAPEFDGALRRHEGRYSVHTHSQKEYDAQMAALAREYLSNGADPALHAFLRLDFEGLFARYGKVIGLTVPVPKLVPIVASEKASGGVLTPCFFKSTGG